MKNNKILKFKKESKRIKKNQKEKNLSKTKDYEKDLVEFINECNKTIEKRQELKEFLFYICEVSFVSLCFFEIYKGFVPSDNLFSSIGILFQGSVFATSLSAYLINNNKLRDLYHKTEVKEYELKSYRSEKEKKNALAIIKSKNNKDKYKYTDYSKDDNTLIIARPSEQSKPKVRSLTNNHNQHK
jgi:hypothetical protein